MKKMLCIILAAMLAVASMACITQAQEGSGSAFEPMLDTETSCQITVVGKLFQL